MNDYQFDRMNSLAAHDAKRRTLAAMMAEYEREHGPVEALPIYAHDRHGKRIMPDEKPRKRTGRELWGEFTLAGSPSSRKNRTRKKEVA